MPAYAALCGRTLARAHARSGDTAVLAGYMGKSETMDDALASFAMLYAEQTKRDHARLLAAKTPAKNGSDNSAAEKDKKNGKKARKGERK